MFEKISKFISNKKNTKNIREINDKFLNQINHNEDNFKSYNDQELKDYTQRLKKKYIDKNNEVLTNEDIIIAISIIREVAFRTIGLRPFNSQIIGGIILHYGFIAEMKTGEGKTLVATIPIFINFILGKKTHIVTVNDYLAKRDATWMEPVYSFLGITSSYIQNSMGLEDKIDAYKKDVVYGNNNEFCFDFLRDNLRSVNTPKIQLKHDQAIIDEADSVLIDESRSPLGISGQIETPTELFKLCYQLTNNFNLDDVEINEERKSVLLNDNGIKKIEFNLVKANLLKGKSLFDSQNLEIYQIINQSLKARFLLQKDKDYVLKEKQIIIIDEFSGRLSEGRRFGEGLHQSIEAKEGVTIQPENTTLASITFQNFFKKYESLSGMTGTALTESEEFNEIYGLNVLEIPTNKDLIRKDFNDQIFRTKDEKFNAIVNLVKDKQLKGQPVLIGTTSIEKSEMISEILEKNKIKHNVLNAKNHENEAYIIAQAGRLNQVTVATNMAGRGTDIKLGGNPEFNKEDFDIDEYGKVIKQGGLCIIGTERHESRRIDNQLRGRSGRQGDPGESIFFVSLEDDLMRIFGSEKLQTMLSTLGLKKDEVIEHKWLTSSIERAQKRVESHNFDIRKQLLQFDNIINQQREIIYNKREYIITDNIFNFIKEVENEFLENLWQDEIKVRDEFLKKISLPDNINKKDLNKILLELDIIKKTSFDLHHENYEMLLKQICLMIFDKNWQNQIQELGNIRSSVAFSGHGGKDPINEFKKGAFVSFNNLIYQIQNDIVQITNNLKISDKDNLNEKQKEETQKKIGRNDMCPCGSEKKYKHCHGK